MKKIIAVFVVVISLSALSSCKDKKSEPHQDEIPVSGILHPFIPLLETNILRLQKLPGKMTMKTIYG